MPLFNAFVSQDSVDMIVPWLTVQTIAPTRAYVTMVLASVTINSRVLIVVSMKTHVPTIAAATVCVMIFWASVFVRKNMLVKLVSSGCMV